MKVTKQGVAPVEFPKAITCGKCLSELEYEKEDVVKTPYPEDPRESDIVECPVCKNHIIESLGKTVIVDFDFETKITLENRMGLSLLFKLEYVDGMNFLTESTQSAWRALIINTRSQCDLSYNEGEYFATITGINTSLIPGEYLGPYKFKVYLSKKSGQ